MDNYLDLMRARREQILERFYAALDRAGRPHDAARLIAVSKTVGVDETVAAIRVGYRHFAENRPQELVRKLTGLADHPDLPEVRFDMIGNLQTNKINAVLGSAELIHSVSSLHLAQAVSSRAVRKVEAGELATPQRVLIEVNVSGEESKGGFSPDEIRAAAKRVRADDFISAMPMGYQTTVNERGGNLSQGQKQLLCIARVMLCLPPMLILDEATSSIDTRTEAIVQRGMDKLMEGRTVFVIAHRLSTVQNSDVIMVLDHGHIIERGSHRDLIAQKGTYYRLYTGAFELE